MTISKWDLLYPEKNILSALRDLTEGKFVNESFLRRALVVEIDQVGGKLEEKPTKNPKNSIRARIISEPTPHAFLKNADLPVFWPLFPFDILPAKVGEHVYIVYETEGHGLWISRIPEPFEVDDKNITPGIKKYQLNDPNISERQVQDLSSNAEKLEVSPEFQKETVPKFTARIGDRVIEGSNNTLIVLGRDRVDTVDSGLKENAGVVHIVVGRQKEEDLDPENDLSTILVSMSTDVDANFNPDSVGPSVTKTAAIAIRSDEIRIVARKGTKIIVEGGDLSLDATTIILGKDASEAAVLGNKLVTELGKIIDQLVTAPLGLLGQIPVPLNPLILAQLNIIKGTLSTNILSTMNKIK